MVKKYNKKSGIHKKMAVQRIRDLFEQSRTMFVKDKNLSNRYIKLARKMSLKYKVSIPRELKSAYCKSCFSYLMPGKNVRIRISNNKVISYCLDCKHFSRIPLK